MMIIIVRLAKGLLKVQLLNQKAIELKKLDNPFKDHPNPVANTTAAAKIIQPNLGLFFIAKRLFLISTKGGNLNICQMIKTRPNESAAVKT